MRVRYLVWEGDQHDYFGDEIMDLVDAAGIPIWCDILEFEYSYQMACQVGMSELIRISNYQLQRALFTNQRFYLVGCLNVE